MTKQELIWLAAYNLVAVITETRPGASELLDLLESEMRKLVDAETAHWYGFRARTPRCGTSKAQKIYAE